MSFDERQQRVFASFSNKSQPFDPEMKFGLWGKTYSENMFTPAWNMESFDAVSDLVEWSKRDNLLPDEVIGDIEAFMEEEVVYRMSNKDYKGQVDLPESFRHIAYARAEGLCLRYLQKLGVISQESLAQASLEEMANLRVMPEYGIRVDQDEAYFNKPKVSVVLGRPDGPYHQVNIIDGDITTANSTQDLPMIKKAFEIALSTSQGFYGSFRNEASRPVLYSGRITYEDEYSKQQYEEKNKKFIRSLNQGQKFSVCFTQPLDYGLIHENSARGDLYYALVVSETGDVMPYPLLEEASDRNFVPSQELKDQAGEPGGYDKKDFQAWLWKQFEDQFRGTVEADSGDIEDIRRAIAQAGIQAASYK